MDDQDTAPVDETGADDTADDDAGPGVDEPDDVGGGGSADIGGGGKPQDQIGLTGAPCSSSDDCLSTPEHICIFGFCAERCRQNGARLPNSCQVVADGNEFGNQWACADGLSVCMPGDVSDKPIVCSNQAWCDALGGNLQCGQLLYTGGTTVDGVCLPKRSGGAEGQACFTASDCSTRSCLGANADAGISGYCSKHCITNGDCSAGGLCAGVGFAVDDSTTQSTAWAGMCIRPGGSLDGCWAQDVCGEGDVCERFIEPTDLVSTYWCVEGNEGGGAAGETCTTGAECLAGNCFWGQFEDLGLEGYCTWTCAGGDSDCPDGMRCGLRRLHNNGTPDDPDDDPQYKICVAGEAGDPCEIAAKKWCEAGTTCVHVNEDWPDNFGVCTEDLPEPDCATAADCEAGACEAVECTDGVCVVTQSEDSTPCDDGDGCSETDVCTAGECAGTAVVCDDGDVCTADSCADGECVTDPVEDGASCDDGDLCTLGDVCTAGECVGPEANACDDELDCTDDSCAEGACVNALVGDGTWCFIDGECHADGHANPLNACEGCAGADATDAWTAVADEDVLACDDDDACTVDTACVGGVCEGGSLVDCDDDDACNGVESCNPASGCTAGAGLNCSASDSLCGTWGCDAETGCFQDSTTGACDDPTWDGVIGDIIASSCGPCHTGNNSSGSISLKTYAGANLDANSGECGGLTKGEAVGWKVQSDFNTMCGGNRMPKNKPALSQEYQDLFMAWIEAGYPEN